MSINPPAALGPLSAAAVAHSGRNAEASDGIAQTRPEPQPSNSAKIHDGRSESVEDLNCGPKVAPVRAVQVSVMTTNVLMLKILYCTC